LGTPGVAVAADLDLSSYSKNSNLQPLTSNL